MKLVINGMFHTPETVEELFDWCMKHSGSERVVAVTTFMMFNNWLAQNTLHETTQDLAEATQMKRLMRIAQREESRDGMLDALNEAPSGFDITTFLSPEHIPDWVDKNLTPALVLDILEGRMGTPQLRAWAEGVLPDLACGIWEVTEDLLEAEG